MQKNHKLCPKCGKPMHRQSKQCRACFKAEWIKPENYVTKVCPVCKEHFMTHKSHLNRGQGIYCSKSCARSGSPTRKRTAPDVICATCGKRFSKYKSEIQKTAGDLHFCSSRCWYRYNQRENHYMWNGGQDERMNPDTREWRKAVLHRDKGFCRICRSRENLEAHHIKRFGTHPEARWNVDNGLTLCHSCHIKFRHREEEYEEMLSFIASVPLVVHYV